MSNNGINIGEAAIGIWQQGRIDQYGENGPNIAQAVAQIDHLTGTKAELLAAVAYLALQVRAYQRLANEDAALAIRNIESILAQYRSHHD